MFRLNSVARTSLMAATGALLVGCPGGAATQERSAAGDCEQAPTVGVTDDSIKVGASIVQSGALSSLGGIEVAARAYFDMINEQGGVTSGDGKTRKIEFVTLDDGYDPSRAKRNVETLVEQEEVFSLVSSFGAIQLATKPVLDRNCAPSLWVGSGNPAISSPDNPNMTGVAVNSNADGRVFGEFLLKERPDASVGILSQSGEATLPLQEGFEESVKDTTVEIVEVATFEPTDTDVRQQITTLKASGADTLLINGTGNIPKQAMNNVRNLGWDALVLVPSLAAVDLEALLQLDEGAAENVVVGSFFKDPTAPDFAEDEQVKLFREHFSNAGGDTAYPEVLSMHGWLAAHLFVETLRELDTVDRPSLLEASHNLSIEEPTVVVPGVTLETDEGRDDASIVEGLLLQRLDSTSQQLVPIDTIDTNGQ